VFAAIKAGRPTPELLAYQYLQTLPEMAKGEANKVWMVPSDFGKALEGFTRMLGAPGEDGVFRFEPSPVDDAAARPEDDDESVRDWFDTASDPEIARVVAAAEAQARRAVPPPGMPDPGGTAPVSVPPLPVPPLPVPPSIPPSAYPPPQGLSPGTPAASPRPRPATAPTTPFGNGTAEPPSPVPGDGPDTDGPDPGGNGPARPGYPSPPPRG